MDERVRTIEGELSARGLRFGVLAASFNDFIVDRLVAGALDTLIKHGAAPAEIQLVRVPGALEMPVAAKKMAAAGRSDAIVALGCVIRGATPHFDHVCREASSGLAKVGLDFDLALGFGLLTCDTIEQAIERAGTKAGNKGADAALAAIQMVSVLRQLEA